MSVIQNLCLHSFPFFGPNYPTARPITYQKTATDCLFEVRALLQITVQNNRPQHTGAQTVNTEYI